MATQKPKIVYWKPGGAVRAQQVYLDANFLVALTWPAHIWHSNALGLLGALEQRNIKLVLSALAWNEAIYQLLKLGRQQVPTEANNGAAGAEGARPQAQAQAQGWPDRLSEAVLKLPGLVFFEPADAAFHRQTIRGVTELSLDPTDAFHYAACRALACPIVSNDAGFQKIPDQNLVIVTFY